VRLILSTISKNRTATHIPVRVSNILLFLLLSPGTRFPEETGRFANPLYLLAVTKLELL